MSSTFIFRIEKYPAATSSPMQWAPPAKLAWIGRSKDCDWVLDDPARLVSRRHAKVEIRDGQYWWTDMGTNSTMLNGKLIPKGCPVEVNPGDELRIGQYQFTVEENEDIWGAAPQEPPVDVLASISAAPSPLQIDDLLNETDSELFKPSVKSSIYPEQHVPVLARRIQLHCSKVEPVSAPDSFLHSNNPELEAEVRQLRHLLKVSLKGYMQLLQARRVFNEEAGTSLTSLSATGNNPLKFCQSAEEAFTLLMAGSTPAYLPAEQALEQACRDLLQHQQASISRIQALIDQAQAQLSPDAILREAEQTGGFALGLSPTRKARLWDIYCEHYEKLGKAWN